jgi:hypothetical protein
MEIIYKFHNNTKKKPGNPQKIPQKSNGNPIDILLKSHRNPKKTIDIQ